MSRTEIKRVIPRKAGVLIAVVAVLLGVGSALAVHDVAGPMELDGNIANVAGGGSDWQAIFDANGAEIPAGLPAGALDTTGVIQDFVPGATGPDISYHEPSNKDDQAIAPTGNTWACVSAQNPTDKTDIVNAYGMAVQGDGAAGGDGDGDTADDQLFYFGVERFDNSGDAFIGLWLFQDDVGCTADGKFVGSKRTGDVLVLANFTGGGSTATIQLFRYTAGVGSNPGTFGELASVTGKCENTLVGDGPANDLCATINDTNTFVTPWAMEDKIKPGPPNPDPAKEVDPDQFVEGGVNLTDIFASQAGGGTPPPCFGSFLAETRSSSSLDATLKDYALGDLNFCDGRVTINPTETNRVGEQHTFTVKAEQKTGATFTAATRALVSFSLTGSNGISNPVPYDAALSTCDNDFDAGPGVNNVDANGECTIVVNSLVTGKITANATVTFSDLGNIVRDTDPATTNIGSGPGGSGPAVKTYVNAKIDITGDDTNRVDDPHTFTVTVKTDAGDGNGLVAKANQVVSVSLVNSLGANGAIDDTPDTDSTCDDGTNASGQCTVKFVSSLPGLTTGTASATVSVGGISFGISTTSDAAVTGNENAEKRWVDATIDITGDDTNRVNDPHTFTVTVKENLGTGAGYVAKVGQVVTVTLTPTNGSTPVVDDDPDGTSTCDDGTDANGQCVVVFSSATTGITTGTASANVTVGGVPFTITTANDAAVVGNEDATKRWVNAYISIVGNDTNSISESHTFTVTVTKDIGDGNGPVAANGEDVDVTLANAGGADYDLLAGTTCDVVGSGDVLDHAGADTNGSGQCVVNFTSLTAGTVTGSATSTLTVEGVSITVSTSDANSTGSVVKTFVAGSIRWLKHDGDGNLLGGATFEVCRTHRFVSSNGTYAVEPDASPDPGIQPFCFTVLDNAAPDADPTAGELQVNNLILGKYTVRETIPPAGYHIANPPGAGPFSFPDMFIGDPPNAANYNVELSTIFVNIKAFRIIVITCDDISHELVVSSVDLNIGGAPVAVDSMNLIDLSDWNTIHSQNLTQNQICGGNDQTTLPSLGGDASFGDLPEGQYDIRTIVPKAS